MFGSKAFDRLRQMFVDQFEPSGDHFLYRKSLYGAPIQVSAEERDRYVKTYNRFARYNFWLVGGGAIILMILVVSYSVAAATEVSGVCMYVGIGVIIALSMVGHYWTWNLPARELRGRGTVGAAKTWAERQQQNLSKLTYGQLALMLLFPAIIFFEYGISGLWRLGWNWLWLVVAALIVIVAGVQAFRKWRFESSKR